jgi:hypothetical protein
MMISTKTTTQFNKRMADCNVTGVFADFSGRTIIGQF